MANQNDIYIGIDLNDRWAQISYCTEAMDEPETISLVAGEEHYRIPTAICLMQGQGSFCLSDSQGVRAADNGNIYLDRLWSRTLKEESIRLGQQDYQMQELLLVFFKKLFRLIPGLSGFSRIREIAFHVEQLEYRAVKLLREMMEQLGIEGEHVSVLDDRESFCHFAMNQAKELRQYDNVLFVCQKNQVSCFYLSKQGRTAPMQIQIEEKILGELPEDPIKRDEVFSRYVSRITQGKMVSAAYLMGEGLEGGWMKAALTALCRGRRVFQGRNLYTKGACYGSYMEEHRDTCDYIYFGKHKLKRNIFLKVQDGERMRYHDLAEAGESRYEVSASCQVLLSGEPQIEVWFRKPGSGEAMIQSLKLTELPKRPDKMTRLKVELCCGAESGLRFRVTDLGFGSWYPSSGKVWEYNINE